MPVQAKKDGFISRLRIHYYVEAKVAILRRQLTLLFGDISFFADPALFRRFVNMDFANAQRDGKREINPSFFA